jgi:hypothetical protein
MGCLEGSVVPVLYIGRTVPKGYPLVILTQQALKSSLMMTQTHTHVSKYLVTAE